MDVKLVVVGGDAKTSEVSLKLPTIIGRGREASLTLPHPLVSRQHCEIFERDGKLMVRDLGSLNGTFIGKERVSESPLNPGDLLTIGTITFRAVYGEMLHAAPDEPSAANATPATGPGGTEALRGDTTLPAQADDNVLEVDAIEEVEDEGDGVIEVIGSDEPASSDAKAPGLETVQIDDDDDKVVEVDEVPEAATEQDASEKDDELGNFLKNLE